MRANPAGRVAQLAAWIAQEALRRPDAAMHAEQAGRLCKADLATDMVRELTELGLLADLYATGIPTADLVYYSKHGQRIWGEPRGMAAGYKWPQFSIHRGELLGLLKRAVVSRLGPERLHTGHHLQRFGDVGGTPAWAEFADRASGTPAGRVEADLLVGCDGVHSVVRVQQRGRASDETSIDLSPGRSTLVHLRLP